MKENLQNIFIENFLKNYDIAEKKKILLTKEDQLLIERKNKSLDVMREFLSEFVKQGVKVRHKDFYNINIIDKSAIQDQKFMYYDSETSKSWAPGISIMFDHPAEVEIAIPNEKIEGAVIVKVASYHPASKYLERKFHSFEEACKYLSYFLCESTVSVDGDYQRTLSEYERKLKLNNLTINTNINSNEKENKKSPINLKTFTQLSDKNTQIHINNKQIEEKE